MRMRLLGMKWLVPLAAVLMIVAACESTPDDAAATSGDGDATQTASSSSDDSGAAVDSSSMDSDVSTADVSAPIPGTQEDLVQNVGDRVFFNYDSAVLTPEGRRTLERQAEWLRLFPEFNITIEGHCDERGTREYNLALGERRSNAVKDYLVALGIEVGRVATISYGKERMAVLGSNEWAWGQNRRGVSIVN